LQVIVSIKEGGVNEFADYLVWLADREELGCGRFLKRIVK